MPKLRLPRLAYNLTSAVGAMIALVTGITGAVLLGISLTLEPNPYFGIFLYTIIPGVLIVGLLLIPAGMFMEWRRWKKAGEQEVPAWPRIDLNRPAHRNATIVFVVGTLLFAVMSAVGSYEAYHYSESVSFCGTACHDVMEPQHTTYQNSPHARVACAECHIGGGAGWFVKSKLSGSYQLYSVAANKYPRPIAGPIHSLRPAKDTCEQCHWPQKGFGATQRTFRHYRYDEANSEWPIAMLLRTDQIGSLEKESPQIHWHIGARVEYIERDPKRQEIPWIRVTDPTTGKVTVYQDKANPMPAAEIAAATPRVMDCVDCHNRPSHIFHSPDRAIDQLFTSHLLSRSVPSIKRFGVEAMTGTYATSEAAMEGISKSILAGYDKEYAEYLAANRPAVESAIKAIQGAYSVNFFPKMNADWKVYPQNIGHFESIGCMRCHDGNHESPDGQVVKHDCDACHVIVTQGTDQIAGATSIEQGSEFVHPEDIGEAWRDMGCWECHSGTKP